MTLLLFNIFLFVGCSQASHIDELFTSKINVTTTKLSLESDDIIQPIVRLFTVDRYLVIQTVMNKNHLHVYDLKSEKYAYTLYEKGRASNELTSISSIAPYKNGFVIVSNGQLIMNDSLHVDCDKVGRHQKASFHPLVVVPFLNQQRSIATGQFPDQNKHFALLDQNFEIATHFDEFPSGYDMSSQDMSMGLQGKIVSSEFGFMYTSNFGGYSKFYTYCDDKIEKCQEYLFDMPKFKSMSNGEMVRVAYDFNNIIGAFSTTASANEYFLLYSNNSSQSGVRESNTIYTFDEQGEPKSKIVLDRNVSNIFYCKALNALYAFGTQKNKPYLYIVNL